MFKLAKTYNFYFLTINCIVYAIAFILTDFTSGEIDAEESSNSWKIRENFGAYVAETFSSNITVVFFCIFLFAIDSFPQVSKVARAVTVLVGLIAFGYNLVTRRQTNSGQNQRPTEAITVFEFHTDSESLREFTTANMILFMFRLLAKSILRPQDALLLQTNWIVHPKEEIMEDEQEADAQNS